MSLIILFLMGIGFYTGFRLGHKFADIKAMATGVKNWFSRP